tara:strand:+ start:21906 stop:23183 length:1278 start_codon:yes stop_codon:yes gene_type:complete
MQEDFLHYVCQHKKMSLKSLQTTTQEPIILKAVGLPNVNSGPDFFNAQLSIGTQMWAGNVEIHVKSSDWYVHHHETDAAYDSVILHVVWEHNMDVFRKDNSPIPTLELKNYVLPHTFKNYNSLLSQKQSWIPCESSIKEVDKFTINHWIERLYLERLEAKYKAIETQLNESKQDWEAVLFWQLAKNFGLKVNGEAFLSISKSINFSVVRKSQHEVHLLEALFFGQAGLLDTEAQDRYISELKSTYEFLKNKFSLSRAGVVPVQFFRLRPPNFPTIRLAQLAALYSRSSNLFSRIIEAQSLEQLYAVFEGFTSKFWDTHYTFEKTSKSTPKTLTKAFINLLIINTIIPMKFAFNKFNRHSKQEDIVEIMRKIPLEHNSIVDKFYTFYAFGKTVLESQALLQLKQNYCSKNKCLECAIGSALLNRNS